jgi:uncharacterized membrane protein YbhN (UPF0104 family)
LYDRQGAVGKWGERLWFICQAADSFVEVHRHGRSFLIVGAVSVANQLGLIYIFWRIGGDLGLGLDFGQCFCVVPLAILFSMLPLSLGGWGVREAVFASLASALGGEWDMAVLASLLYGFLQVASSLPGAAVWAYYKKNGRENGGEPGVVS